MSDNLPANLTQIPCISIYLQEDSSYCLITKLPGRMKNKQTPKCAYVCLSVATNITTVDRSPFRNINVMYVVIIDKSKTKHVPLRKILHPFTTS